MTQKANPFLAPGRWVMGKRQMKVNKKVRDFLNDERRFLRDEIAGIIPMHFNALYGGLEHLITEAVEAEKEACAKVAEAETIEGSLQGPEYVLGWNNAVNVVVKKIRAREEKP